jgi:hypothetical protein
MMLYHIKILDDIKIIIVYLFMRFEFVINLFLFIKFLWEVYVYLINLRYFLLLIIVIVHFSGICLLIRFELRLLFYRHLFFVGRLFYLMVLMMEFANLNLRFVNDIFWYHLIIYRFLCYIRLEFFGICLKVGRLCNIMSMLVLNFILC